jgi:dipeptidyl aminopeptidase/acylaminoacyl peptidase
VGQRPAAGQGDAAAGPDAGAFQAADRSDVRVFSRLHYKENAKGLWDGKRSHVFVIPAGGGEARQVTRGDYDASSPAWSPDGMRLAFCANRSERPDHTSVADVFVVSSQGEEGPRRLTASSGPAAQPSWSPDGRLVAYYGHDNRYRGATQTHVLVVAAEAGGRPRDILQGWDAGVGIGIASDMMSPSMPAPRWSEDGRRVYFLAAERGACDLYRVAVDPPPGHEGAAGAVERLTSGRHVVYGSSIGPGERIVAAAVATPGDAGDIWACALGDQGQAAEGFIRLTDSNAWLRERSLSEPEDFVCPAPDGGRIPGWLMKPVPFEPGRSYPLILEIHGGPHSAYGYAHLWLGRAVELVRFPDENHELSRSGQPVHRVERLERVVGWFRKYLQRSEVQSIG